MRVAFVGRTAAREYSKLDFDARYYYVSGAMALLEGRGFDWEYHHREPRPPYSAVPPLQSLILAGVFAVQGDYGLMGSHYVQIILNLAAGMILFFVMRRWGGWTAALLFWAGWCFYPEFIRWTGTLLTENNYFLFLALSVWLAVRWAEQPTPARAGAAAAMMGLTNLQRAAGLYLSVFLGGLALCTLKGRQRWFQLAVFIVVPYMVMLPWLIRNLAYNGDPVWTSCNGGLLLQMVNNENYDAAKWPDLAHVPNETWKVPEIEARFNGPEFAGDKYTWFQYSKLYMPVVRSYVLRHPLHFTRNYTIRGWNQFTMLPTTFGVVYPELNTIVARLVFYGLLVLGLAGAIGTRRAWREPAHRALAVSFFYFAAFGALMPGLYSGRYSMALRVFLLLFAARLIGRTAEWLLQCRRGGRADFAA